MAVEGLQGRGCLVCDGPAVNGCVGNYSNCCFRDPLPNYNPLVVDVRFYFPLRVNTENLECAAGWPAR
jgi:hypothetical protein